MVLLYWEGLKQTSLSVLAQVGGSPSQIAVDFQ